MKLSKEAKALIDKWFDNKTPEEVDYIISKYTPNKQLNIHSVSVCSLADCNKEVSKNSNTLCIEHAYQRKMEVY